MPLRIVLFYNQGQAGWTETFYSPEDDPYNMLRGLSQSQWEKFLRPRTKLTKLFAARATDLTNPRRSYLLRLNSLSNPGFDPADPYYKPDVVSTTCVLALRTATNKWRRVFLRGLRDGDVQRTNEGAIELSGQLVTDIRAYIANLQQQGWQMRYLAQPPEGALAWARVISVEPSLVGITLSDLTLSQNPVAGIGPGAPLRFQGVPHDELPGFPRVATILAYSAGPPIKVTIGYRLRNVGAVVPSKMRATLQQFIYATFLNFEIQNFSEHKTGRPFGSLRGRARALVRAQ